MREWLDTERLRFEFQNLAHVCGNALRELDAERSSLARQLADEMDLDADAVECHMRQFDREFFESLTLAKFREIRAMSPQPVSSLYGES